MTAPKDPPPTIDAPRMSGKVALAVIGVGTILIAGGVALLVRFGRDEGRLRPSPAPPPALAPAAVPS